LSSTDSCQNPGNSQNSGGINFGRGTCQIGKTIPAEFRTEFEFRRNAGITIDGITPEWQIERRRLPMLDLGIINKQTHTSSKPPPPSMTSTLATIASLPPPRHHHINHLLPLSPSVTHNHHNTVDTISKWSQMKVVALNYSFFNIFELFLTVLP
jgi:hypothetical protein